MVVILGFFGRYFFNLNWKCGVVLCVELNIVDSILELVLEVIDVMILELLLEIVVGFFIELGIEVVRLIEEVENEVFKVVFDFE